MGGLRFTNANVVLRPWSSFAIGAAMVALLLQGGSRLVGQAQLPEPTVLARLKWVHPHLLANDLKDVGYFGDIGETELNYVVVGSGGAVLTSEDADCWTPHTVRGDLISLTAGPIGNYRFYAGGVAGILASWRSDSRNWSAVTLPGVPSYTTPAGQAAKIDIKGVAFGADRLVVVGNDGNVGMTTDMDAWYWNRALPAGITNDLVSVAYFGGQFSAATATNMVVTSRDGTNWFPTLVQTPLKRIRATAAGFIGISVDERIGTSADGKNWSFIEAHNQGTTSDIIGANGELVLVGMKSLLSSSATLTDWRKIGVPTLVTNENFNAITRGSGASAPFVLVGDRGTILRYTAGATRAVSANNDRLEDLTGVAYGDGRYAAVGKRGVVWSRTDGTNGALYRFFFDEGAWDARGSGITNDLSGIAYGKSRFVAVGGSYSNGTSHATILTSRDAITWSPSMRLPALTDPETGKKAYPAGIVFGGDRFVVLAQGEAGAAMVSTDGSKWDTVFSPVLNGMRGIGYGNGKFIAVGTGIAMSDDGFTWTLDESVNNATLYSATGGNGTFIAVGEGGTSVLVKTNGQPDWTNVKLRGAPVPLTSIGFGAGHFVACGAAGNVIATRNGVTWYGDRSTAQFQQRAIILGNNEYVMVGDRGDITVSPKVDAVTGLPAPMYHNTSGGGTLHDVINAIAYTGNDDATIVGVGAYRGTATFGRHSLGDPAAPSVLPSFLLTHHSDTGAVNLAVSGPVNSVGTHISIFDTSTLVGGYALNDPFPAGNSISASGVGFVAGAVAGSSFTRSNCFNKITIDQSVSLSAGAWARQFDGTLTDLKQFPGGGGLEVRFAGTFGQLIDLGEDLIITSTNTSRAFFLLKCNADSGTNTWVRWLEPTNQAPTEQIYGLKLAPDSLKNTWAFGAVNGGINIYSNTPPPVDTGGGTGEGEPTGDTNEVPKFALQGSISATNHPPGLAMFATVWDKNGKLTWTGNIGPAGGIPVAAGNDSLTNVYVAGNAGSGTIFISAYRPVGTNAVTNVWTKLLTPGGGAEVTAMDVAANGMIAIAGTFQKQATFSEAVTIGTTNLVSGGTAAFVLRIQPDGRILSAQAEGTAAEQTGFTVVNSIKILEPNRLAIGGYFVQQALIGSKTVTSRGLGDAFVSLVEAKDPPPLAPPTLKITRLPKSVRLEWPAAFILQRSLTISPTKWVDFPATPPLEVSPSQAAQFYRLRSP